MATETKNMIDATIQEIKEEFESALAEFSRRLDQTIKIKETIIREYESLEDHRTIDSLTDYLRLVAVNASDLLTIRDELVKKVELKERDYMNSNETLLELKSKSTASDIYITELKQKINWLKKMNSDLQDEVKSEESPLILELFKNVKGNSTR